MPKRVLIVSGSGDYTGACKMAQSFGRAFRAAGWTTNFLIGPRPTDGTCSFAEELSKDGFAATEETGFDRLRSPALIGRTRKLIRNLQPDLVVSFVQIDLKIVGPACRAEGIPYVVSDQTLHTFHGAPPLRWLKRKFFAWELRRAAAVIASSTAVQEQAVREFGCSPGRTFVIPNGIDTSVYVSDPPSRNNLPPRRADCLRLLNVGRIDEQKGQLQLINAVARCRDAGLDCDLLLVGGTTVNNQNSERYFAEVKAAIARHGLADRIHLLGWRTDVNSILRAADVYVHSANWEGFPLAVVEAMASARPVVLTDCVGSPNGFEKDVHGRVVQTGNEAAIADGILWAGSLTTTERTHVGQNAQRLAREEYDVRILGERFVQRCALVIANAQ